MPEHSTHTFNLAVWAGAADYDQSQSSSQRWSNKVNYRIENDIFVISGLVLVSSLELCPSKPHLTLSYQVGDITWVSVQQPKAWSLSAHWNCAHPRHTHPLPPSAGSAQLSRMVSLLYQTWSQPIESLQNLEHFLSQCYSKLSELGTFLQPMPQKDRIIVFSPLYLCAFIRQLLCTPHGYVTCAGYLSTFLHK